MKGFIEIHTANGNTHLVNIRHIVGVHDNVIYTDDILANATDFPRYECLECYEEIKKKIKEAT